ncbi:unnamed protein product [Diatraea saccharalis]|uniref:Uncharacterized protein n=1 Tax=Diatraea saccharalis TaxID=40085 RepID=A0A9N9QPA5_9NEOP|nr:unnamed protein product [Diatraea saccharalis]
MSNIATVLETQRAIEETLMQRTTDFEAHLKVSCASSSSAVDMKALSTDYCHFKSLVGGILALLRQQIDSLVRNVDIIETRHRNKALLVGGVEEKEGEDLLAAVSDVCNNKLGLNNISRSSFTVCHRLGANTQDRPRPILMRFAELSTKSDVWTNKTKLKGSSIVLSEFLTRRHQDVFVAARNHFGIRSVWTKDGNIIVKLPNGKLCRVRDGQEFAKVIELNPITPAEVRHASGSKPAAESIAIKSSSARTKRLVKK